MDPDGRILAWNGAAEGILGHPASRMVGQICHDVLCAPRPGPTGCQFGCGLEIASSPLRQAELTVTAADGRPVRVALCVLSLPGEGDSPAVKLHFFQPLEETRSALTTREQQILAMLAEGCHTKEVAQGLCISVVTVRNHVQNIFRKLDAHTRVEAIVTARRLSLI